MDNEKKIEFKIDDIDFKNDFFNKNNLLNFQQKIKEADGIDKGAFAAFSENALTSINFYLEESCPNDISRQCLLNRIIQLCNNYENAPKKKSKKVAKIMAKLRENLTRLGNNNTSK